MSGVMSPQDDRALREVREEDPREVERRYALHRQIGALRTQLDAMGLPIGTCNRNRYFKLLNKLRSKEASLAQPRLPL